MSEESATPRQVAYLRYMGYPASPSMGKEKASYTIDHLYELLASDELRYEYPERQSQWRRDRFVLHRDLYNDYELNQFVSDELSEVLHEHVRKRIVGASQRLTKTKIREVINSLTSTNREWWREPNYQQTFFECLERIHPACCDGHSPPRISRLKASPQPGASMPIGQRRANISKSIERKGSPLSGIIIILAVIVLVIVKILSSR